jgi:alanyl-tRNA synthetase
MDSRTVRQTFLDFFKSKGHEIVPSAPVVNRDDPTLMFVNAGMNPFKDIFTGHKSPTFLRVADTQKCLRVSGKHNDLEEVGRDTYHHTFFEMLGNWSFGDYFRTEAIAWAWELLVDVFKIDPNRLYTTFFSGDEISGLSPDIDSEREWKQLLPADRVLGFSKRYNFWEMGDTGPCGPCTEIHIDLRSEAERAALDGRELVNQDHPQVIELWNLVLIQFNRKAGGELEELHMKSIDTGMGFERLCMVLQGKQSNYDTDIFTPLLSEMEGMLGVRYGLNEPTDIALRVAADHLRAVCFTIADGQLPGNSGPGYVIRRLIRRASRYGYKFLGANAPYLYRLVPALVAQMGHQFPELQRQRQLIGQILEQEEKNFIDKLTRGSLRFDDYLARHIHIEKKIVEGQFAFELFDTFGFPFDLTQLMAQEAGWQVDVEGFEAAMAQQRQRSRKAAEKAAGDWVFVQPNADLPSFTGYDSLVEATHITRYRMVKSAKSSEHHLTIDRCPFYAESGGQVGDTGFLDNGEEQIAVLDTYKENELIVLRVDHLPENPAGTWKAQVDAERRRRIRAHHSATHLLQAALRQVLGTHVEQRGSLVGPDYLRFDFSHFQKVEPAELRAIERLVNEQISAALPCEELRNVPFAEAQQLGAMALFGEKYGEFVRVIRFGANFSTELCGGTHVANTLEIRYFRIRSESSIAAGIRRIEALASDAALDFLETEARTLAELRQHFPVQQPILVSVLKVLEEKKELEKKLATLRNQQLMLIRDRLIAAATSSAEGLNAIVALVEVVSGDEMKQLAFELRKISRQTVICLGSLVNDKPLLTVILSEDLNPNTDLNAKTLVNLFAKAIEGGGGGQDFYATAGGKYPGGLMQALKLAAERFGTRVLV